MRKIKLTFNSLYALSDTVGEFSNDLHMKIVEMNSILESIEANRDWVGDDQTKYYQLVKEKYMNSLEQVNRTLDDYSTFLEKSCLSKESLENDMISKEISIY